jgi:hypothetical protein
MQNTIAMLFDFDLTLTNEYSEDAVFRRYGIDPSTFDSDLRAYHDELQKELLAFEAEYAGPKAPDSIKRVGASQEINYINYLLHLIRKGRCPGLSRAILREEGKNVALCDGLWKGLFELKDYVKSIAKWRRHGIELKYYIVSASLFDLIMGSLGEHAQLFDGIYANEILPEEGADPVHGEIGRHIGPMFDTVKTRVVYQVHKGHAWHVNDKVAYDLRDVPGYNFIGIGDGFTDTPFLAVIKKKGGTAIGVYAGLGEEDVRKNKEKTAKLLESHRVDGVLQADYRKGSPLRKYLEKVVSEIAERNTERLSARRSKLLLPFGD